MLKKISSFSSYEFYIKVKNKLLEEFEHNGDTFVEGRKGSEYEIYFKNNTFQRVLVVFSVDGLSVMDGKPASEKSKGYVIDAWKEVRIPGWRVNDSKVAKFQFQPQGASANSTYVELLLADGFDVDKENQGVIGLMVFEENNKIFYNNSIGISCQNYPYLYDSGSRRISYPDHASYFAGVVGGGVTSGFTTNQMGQMNMSINSATATTLAGALPVLPTFNENGMGTGWGDSKKFETTNTSFDMKDNPSWIAVINYDTIHGLRKKGVIKDKQAQSKAFPNYKSDGCYVPTQR